MNKSISTQFFLRQILNNNDFIVLNTHKNKKDILNLYRIVCEKNPEATFQVVREEILTEIIAESEDHRQALLPLE